MKCSKARALMCRYVDSQLDEALARAVADHLGQCPSCRAEEAAQRGLSRVLDAWPEMEPVRGFGTLAPRLEQSHTAPRTGLVLPVPRWAAGVLAAMSIAGGVALGLLTPSGDAVREAPTPQQVAAAMDLLPHDALEVSFAYSAENGLSRPTDVGGQQ